jgi:hypothetical protein
VAAAQEIYIREARRSDLVVVVSVLSEMDFSSPSL